MLSQVDESLAPFWHLANPGYTRYGPLVPKLYPCEPVDLDFISSAPFRLSNSVEVAVTPEQLFEVLGDAESWPRFSPVIAKAIWTSPSPYGVGTTRRIEMRVGIVGDEEFLAWEPSGRMTFRFNGCSSRAVAALAEDYRIESASGGCRLTWTLAMKAQGPSRWALLAGKPVMNLASRGFLAGVRRYAEKRFATAD
jgi:carbon monoxide dehydrogenase subunit G